MKSRITKQKSTKDKPYPKLVIGHNIGGVLGNDVIVCMHEAGKGQILHIAKLESSYTRKVGEYHIDWQVHAFEDFNGKVTNQNS